MADPTPTEVLLSRLKIDLGIINSTMYDSRLTSLLQAAKKEIIREGASTLDDSDVADGELIIDYARWMWLKRKEPTEMPRDLRWRLNNRIFGEKARGEANDE